jgi:hypothetical protein
MHRPLLYLTLITLCSASALPAQATPVAAPSGAARTPAALPADSFDLARKYTRWFYSGELDSLVAHNSSEGRKDPDLRNRLNRSLTELTSRAGKEIWVSDERFITRNGNRQYWRTATFSAFTEPLLVRWVMNSKGEIAGLGMGPASDAPPIDPAP